MLLLFFWLKCSKCMHHYAFYIKVTNVKVTQYNIIYDILGARVASVQGNSKRWPCGEDRNIGARDTLLS